MPLIATVTGVPGEHAAKQPDAEGEIERKGMSKGRMIETTAVGAGVGAIAGGAAGGGKGAGIGAGAGAGLGALAGVLSQRNLRLNKNTVLEVRLDHPLQIPR
jgi:outer membrane lipoprotein SlyB